MCHANTHHVQTAKVSVFFICLFKPFLFDLSLKKVYEGKIVEVLISMEFVYSSTLLCSAAVAAQ